MKLPEYLKHNKINQSQFAKKIGVKQQSVSDYCVGKPPKRATAYKIVKVTKGAVTLADLWNM